VKISLLKDCLVYFGGVSVCAANAGLGNAFEMRTYSPEELYSIVSNRSHSLTVQMCKMTRSMQSTDMIVVGFCVKIVVSTEVNPFILMSLKLKTTEKLREINIINL